ncbi:MAG: SemiSWEET transporter [Hyphomonadaceae bacterium]|nr:SemiSWEET transporter [Hyphomonadaceae bacterium]MBP9234619.1 SemiSWEET transporter [Hyphomonadaceae bacterium]
MPLAEIVGSLAAFLTTASFLPQAIKVLRTRETGAISLVMYSMFTAGVTFWGIYGVMTMQWSIIIANAVTVVLASIILSMKVREVMTSRTSRSGN